LNAPSPEFDWDDGNRRHLSLHRIAPDEAEQAILDPNAVLLEIQTDDVEERIKVLGMTMAGHILTVVFTFRGEAIRPITAYAATARLQGLYLKARGV
jgi:uncharacterized DUF497 family protein